MQMIVKKWGNSLATRFPKAVVEAAGLKLDQKVDIEVIDGKVVIEPVKSVEYKLEDLLSKCEPENMALSQEDYDWINAPSVGKEVVDE